MKKLLIALTLCTLALLTACAQPQDAQIPNPLVEAEGSDDFAEIGIMLKAPAGAEDAAYAIINGEVAQIDYTLDGVEYGLRASKTLHGDEIHGMNFDFEDEMLGVDADGDNYSYSVDVKMVADGDGGVAIATVNVQDEDPLYITLSVLDDMSADTLLSMISDIVNLSLES